MAEIAWLKVFKRKVAVDGDKGLEAGMRSWKAPYLGFKMKGHRHLPCDRWAEGVGRSFEEQLKEMKMRNLKYFLLISLNFCYKIGGKAVSEQCGSTAEVWGQERKTRIAVPRYVFWGWDRVMTALSILSLKLSNDFCVLLLLK